MITAKNPQTPQHDLYSRYCAASPCTKKDINLEIVALNEDRDDVHVLLIYNGNQNTAFIGIYVLGEYSFGELHSVVFKYMYMIITVYENMYKVTFFVSIQYIIIHNKSRVNVYT